MPDQENVKFFIVVRDGMRLAAHKRHSSLAEAVCEARRLAAKEKARFYVLDALGYSQPTNPEPPIEWVTLTPQAETKDEY